jgi:hypothetical protein
MPRCGLQLGLRFHAEGYTVAWYLNYAMGYCLESESRLWPTASDSVILTKSPSKLLNALVSFYFRSIGKETTFYAFM